MNSHLSDPTEPSEIGLVLFTDIVAYSQLSTREQRKVNGQLKDIARNNEVCRLAESKNAIVYRPTGDGLALIFFGDPEAPVRCAIEMSQKLKHNQVLTLRMGIHSGPIIRVTDIMGQADVVGEGINTAQRVMDFGDAGHILLSRTIADILIELGDWKRYLHELGEVTVKHGRKVHLYNFYDEVIGNKNAPARLPQLPVSSYAASDGSASNSDSKMLRLVRKLTNENQTRSQLNSEGKTLRLVRTLTNANQTRSRYCPRCGMLLQGEDASCVYCGT